MKYLKEEGYEIDDTIMEEVIGFGEIFLKRVHSSNDILNKEEEEPTAQEIRNGV